MNGTMVNLVRLINEVQGLINPIIKITSSLVGNSSFFTLINCKFIGSDISNVIQAFSGPFSTSSKNLGVLIVIISFINAVMIIATIWMINFTLEPKIQGVSPNNDMESGVELKHLN